MKLAKLFVAVAGFAVVAAASAQYTSPELMFVADYGGTTANGNTVGAQIERYDPYSGQYLGSFGAGYVTAPTGMVVVGSDLYVTCPFAVGTTRYTRIVKLNYSTGAYDGQIFSGGPFNLFGIARYGTNTLASDYGTGSSGDGVYTYDANGAQAGFSALPAGTNAESIATDGSHDFIASAGHGVYSYNLNAAGVSTGLNFNVGTGNYFYGLATAQNTAGAYRVFAAGETSAGVGLINVYSPTGGLLDTYSSSTDDYNGLAFGHNGVMYGLTGGNAIQRFDTNFSLAFGPLGSFSLNDSAFAVRVAVFAAPEPYSVTCLAVGMLALARRRRHRTI